MDYEFFKIAGAVAGIGGLALAAVAYTFREVIRKEVFPQLTKEQAYKLLNRIIVLIFVIGVVGIIAYLVVNWQNGNRSDETSKQQRAVGTAEKPPQPEEENVLHGEVRDEQGKGIPGVNISVVGGNEKTESDENGRFTLKVRQTTDGQVRLKASRVGYGTLENYFQIRDVVIIPLNKSTK